MGFAKEKRKNRVDKDALFAGSWTLVGRHLGFNYKIRKQDWYQKLKIF